MKRLWKQFWLWVLVTWFPWQYDVEQKLRNAPRQHIGLDCTASYERFLSSWKWQVRREKFLGDRIMKWMRKTGDRYFYPKSSAALAQ
jgi:hypothetical protein